MDNQECLEVVVGVPERLQPTLKEIYEHYRARPKKEYGANVMCADSCLITNVIAKTYPQIVYLGDIEVHPSSQTGLFTPMVYFWVGTYTNTESAQQELDPVLNRLALYFDSYGEGREHERQMVRSGTCVRIIERFARREGIDLG